MSTPTYLSDKQIEKLANSAGLHRVMYVNTSLVELRAFAASVMLAAVTEAFVICCNDSVEFIELGSYMQAKIKLEALRREYFERNRGAFVDEDAYLARCNWHIQAVPVPVPVIADPDLVLLRQALVALEYHRAQTRPIPQTDEAIKALHSRLTA